jgi:hypothetical protein
METLPSDMKLLIKERHSGEKTFHAKHLLEKRPFNLIVSFLNLT